MNPNVFSQRKPKLYSSIYDQAPKPLNASTMPPAGAIGQSTTGQYIYPQQPKIVEPKPEVRPEPTLADQKINLQTETANQQAKYIKDLFANRAKTYQNQIPGMESRFNQYKQEQENAIREAEKATEQEKLAQEELYGGELRQSAQTGREGRARVANQFAGYNTLDSSAYGQALVNQEDALRREQAGIRSQQTRAGLQSQRELSQFKREANNAIASEASKLQDRINEINAVLGEGSIEADNEIAKAYQTARENILNIKQSLLSTENELNKYKVSQSYLQTGIPSTMADYIFRQSEPEKAQKFEEMIKGGTPAGKMTEKQKAFQAASEGAQYAKDLLTSGKISTGLGQSTIGKVGEYVGYNTPEQQDYRSTIGVVRTTLKNALLGANMSPAEMSSLEPFIPSFSDAPNIARQKLDTFIREAARLSGQSQQSYSNPATSNGQTINMLAGLNQFVKQ